MGKYLLSITALAVALDLLEVLSAEKYKAITRGAVSVILTVAIITPIPSLVEEIKREPDFSYVEKNEGEDICLASFEEGIARYIAAEFNLSRECISVEAVGFDVQTMRAERILITLSGSAAMANYKRIEKTVSELNLGEAVVKIEI